MACLIEMRLTLQRERAAFSRDRRREVVEQRRALSAGCVERERAIT